MIDNEQIEQETLSHDVIRRLLDDAYRAQESGMSVGLPRVSVDASQLKVLLAAHDYWRNSVRDIAQRCERFIAERQDSQGNPYDIYSEGIVDAACHILQLIDVEDNAND